MGGGSRMNDQGLGIAHIRQVTQKMRVLDEFDPRFHAAFHAETKYGPRAFGQVLARQSVVFVVFEAGVLHPGNRLVVP